MGNTWGHQEENKPEGMWFGDLAAALDGRSVRIPALLCSQWPHLYEMLLHNGY